MPKGQNICITGGAGSIGSELVRQLAPHNKIFILDNNETQFFNLLEELRLKGYDVHGKVGDVRTKNVFEDIVSSFGYPNLIYHCAALKHVTPSAWNPDEYVQTNIAGTLNVLRFAKRHSIKMINVSTDKTVQPNSIMGATKKVAEIAVRDAGQISVRFGNVLGSRGSVLEIWQRQMEAGEPLTITDKNATRYMMTIPQACQLIIRASEIGNPGEIMVLDMGKKVNILNLAVEILERNGSNVGVKMIGMRPGETMTEVLMTAEEESRVEKIEDFFVIKP